MRWPPKQVVATSQAMAAEVEEMRLSGMEIAPMQSG